MIYHFSYQEGEREIAQSVFSLLFPLVEFQPFIICNQDYNLDDCVFLHFKVNILAQSPDWQPFLKQIKQLKCKNWHLNPWPYDKSISYSKRIAITKTIADNLENDGIIKNAEQELIWLRHQNNWFLGEISYNPYNYKKRIKKPHNYSYALPTRLCHQIIQITNHLFPIGNIIDPCCGTGTLVIEGLISSREITGIEINPLLAQQARENIIFFQQEPNIIYQDMLTLTHTSSIMILDIPYGHYTPFTTSKQLELINKCLSLTKYLVLISNNKYNSYLSDNNCIIIMQTNVKKGNLIRWLTFCHCRAR